MAGRVAAVLVAAALTAGCGRPPGDRMREVDIIEHEAAAEKRPVGGHFELREVSCGGNARMALSVPASSRVILPLMLPARGVLTTGLAVDGPPGSAVLFRIGISDDRIYEPLESIRAAAEDCGAGWLPMSVDLHRYAGRKFSLFFQPDRRTWRLVLATNVEAGEVTAAYWGRPEISSDPAGARDYFERVRRKGRLR